MPALFESHQPTHAPDQHHAYVHYLARQRGPMIHALMLMAALAYTVAVVAGVFLRTSPFPLWLRLVPLPLLLLVALATRRARRPRSLSLLALSCVLLLEIGINLNNIGHAHGPSGIMPGLLLPVASSVIWLGRRDFIAAMTLCALGPLPMLTLNDAGGVQTVQYVVYMAIAIALSAVLRTFMERALFAQFRLEQQLRERADTDDLTGLLLRNRFLELARLACMLYLDADHFKQLNDDYGHAAGDEALVALAAAMRAELRQSDLIGRIGGEEFAILLPGLDLDHASGRAERLRLSVRTIQRPDGPLTASIGIAACDSTSDTIETLLARADQAMRQAKRGGRDRVVNALGR